MPKSLTSFFIDDAAFASRSAELPLANWNSGMLGGGSCSPGIGIGTETPGLDESLPNWTLNDQFGNPRQAQIGQHIGGSGLGAGLPGTQPDATIRMYDNDTLDGSGTLALPAEGAWLASLATGWEEDPTP